MAKLWHSAQLSLREYRSVVTHEVWANNAGGAYSYSTLEDSFEADLNVASLLHGKIIDQLHHRLWSTRVDSVEVGAFQHVLNNPWNLVLFTVGTIVRREKE